MTWGGFLFVLFRLKGLDDEVGDCAGVVYVHGEALCVESAHDLDTDVVVPVVVPALGYTLTIRICGFVSTITPKSELHSKSFVSNFWGVVQMWEGETDFFPLNYNF